MISFFNTKTRQLESFNPLVPGKVSMYHCGPTVYAPAHVGNLCPYIYWDVMRRMFENLGYEVTQVMNLTDIGHIIADQDSGEDKMVSALVEAGKELTIENLHAHGSVIARKYLSDMKALNIKIPHHLPYASKHIAEDIEIIEKLTKKGFTYTIENDAIYFDTSKIDDYDKFKVHGDLNPEHARLDSASLKKSPRDFALWKFSKADSNIGWESPWGRGFPGWHIECSAMAFKYLGESFDIHTGGIEHIPIHHTNEIAQSETAFDKPMARYWLHNNHLHLNGKKISKSDGNVMYLDELESMGFHPADYRYLILTSHYRSEQNLTPDSLSAARASRESLYKLMAQATDNTVFDPTNTFVKQLIDVLDNDMDTPGALASCRTLLQHDDLTDTDRLQISLFITEVLGLKFNDFENRQLRSIPEEIRQLLNDRQKAREEKDFARADQLRLQIEKAGYEIKDTPTGIEVTRRL